MDKNSLHLSMCIDVKIDGKVHDTDNPQNMLLFNRKHFIGITFTCPYYQHKTLSKTHTQLLLSVKPIVEKKICLLLRFKMFVVRHHRRRRPWVYKC